MANYINNLGQTRLGWRGVVSTSQVTASTLLSSIYGVWNADTLGTSLDTSIFRAYNGEAATVTPTQLSTNIFGVWNAEALGASLDTSIHRVYNGDNVNDTSGNGQNGTNVGSVTFTTGKVGNAFTFNGSNYVGLPDNSLKLIGDFSISLWINANSIGGGVNQALFGTYFYDGNTYGWRLDFINTTMRFGIFGSTQVDLSLSNTFNTGQWYHIVITRKASTGTKAYINGVLNVSNTSTINPNYATTQYTTIGATQYNASSVTYYLNGKLDALNVWTKELTAGEVVNLYNSGNGAEYPFSTQTLDSLNDAVGTNHGTTPASTLTNGVPGPSFTTGKIGKAFTFDGINDIVRLSNNSLDLTGDFSISMWANWGRNNTSQILMSNFTIGASTRGWFIEHAAGQLRFRGFNSTGGNAFYIYTAYTPPLNTWVHYTFVHKNNSNKMYADGVLIGSDTGGSTHVAYDTPNYPMIGANQYNATTYQEFFLGKLDAVSVWNRELTADEITALYNSGNGQQYPFSSVTLSNSMLDSVNAQNGTNVNNVTLTTGKIGNAFTFNGSNYISLPDNSLNSLTGDFSIACWVKIGSSTGSKMIIGNLTEATPGGARQGFRFEVNSNIFQLDISNASGTTTLQAGGDPLTVGVWHHVVLTRKGSTGTRIYVNGSSSVSNSDTRNPSLLSTMYTTIGVNRYGTSSFSAYFNGSLDGITVWNKELTASEVFNLYNDGAGAEYPFTSQYLASLKDSVGSNDGTRPSSTLTGGVLGPSFTTGKIGKAFTFDGINDYIQLPNNSLNSLTGDFSISMWFYPVASDSSYRTIISTYVNNGGLDYGWELDVTNGAQPYFAIYGTSTVTLQRAYTFNLNQWNHFVVTRKASTGTKFYHNGIEVISNTSTVNPRYYTTMYPSIGALRYGVSSVAQYQGNGNKIDALSVWNKELSASEVTELYNSGNGKQYPY